VIETAKIYTQIRD